MRAEDMFRVAGNGIVVTGGASGIGLAIAEVLSEHGARVAIFDLDHDRLARESERLRGSGGEVRAVPVDLTDAAAVDRAFDETVDAFGRLDTVFANAGIDPGASLLGPGRERNPAGATENYEDERWLRMIDANLHSVFRTARSAVRHMRPRGGGSIVLTTSVASVRVTPVAPVYSVAKAGVAHLMRSLALELARYQIRVNAIAPGPFLTDIGGGHMRNPEVQQGMARSIPLGRIGQPEEMKGLALFLASPASSFMTGAEIFNDGGMSIGPPID